MVDEFKYNPLWLPPNVWAQWRKNRKEVEDSLTHTIEVEENGFTQKVIVVKTGDAIHDKDLLQMAEEKTRDELAHKEHKRVLTREEKREVTGALKEFHDYTKKKKG